MSPVQCYTWWCPSLPSAGGDLHLPRYHHATVGKIARISDRFITPSARASRRLADVDDEARHRQRAALFGIGTANPANSVRQDEYADWYFSVTGSEHLPQLKNKMKRMCDKSGIHRRYFHHSESTIRQHPILLGRGGQPSLDARQDMLASAVPELAAAAAEDAIAEWGRPATDITDLVVSTYSGAHMPGADLRLASLLGLRPSVRRTVLYLQGCTAGGAALRVAKDIAENNPGARVLVACAELTLVMFRAPDDDAHPEGPGGTLVMQSMFADGASAAVVGARPEEPVELPIYKMVSASQSVILATSSVSGGRAAAGVLNEAGLVFHPSSGMPALVRQNIQWCVADALRPLGLGRWNDLFWAVQPSGRAILDAVEAGLALEADKLNASRRVLREYGYMSGASMLFVLDELRVRSRRADTAAGDLGVMLAIGPGISVESMLLRVPGSNDSKN